MALLALLSLALVLFSFFPKNITLTQAQCHPDQRQALIQLKQGFKTTELHSWNASIDCCIWDGITCDEQTGMVTALNLFDMSISGELNPALFNLSSLQYLDISGNYYNITLPQTGFERLGNLTHLDLSLSYFVGQVPNGISALTNLITLDLSYNTMHLHNTSLKTLLSNLTKLQVLRLDWVDISLNGSEWGSAILHGSPTLQNLSMSDCGLIGNFPDEILHLRNITELVLSYNSMLSDQLPDSIGNLQYLSMLDLSSCNISGQLPDSIGNLQYLSMLDLSSCNISGQLPDSIGNLQYLSMLDLSYCNIYGEVPPSISNLPRLEKLYLLSNRLTGMVPMSLFTHPSLKLLSLFDNQLSGYLTEFSNGSSILEYINLENNNLQGPVPILLFKSPKLVELNVASNNFNSAVNLAIIKQNKKLSYLGLSNNKLSIIEGKNYNESFYSSYPQLEYIGMASCNLTKIPSFLSYQTNIRFLDLSNNKIDGVIPNWLLSKITIRNLNLSHNLFTQIEEGANYTSLNRLGVLDVSSNRILGPTPLLPPRTYYVDFSSNYFSWLPPYFVFSPAYLFLYNNSLTGEIPLSVCNATSLTVFDLSYNNLTGTIPPCLINNAKLEILNLKSNVLRGPMSQNISQGCIFGTIDLNGNKINGSLPQSLMNCNNLEVLDLGNNQIVDRFPFWLGSLDYLNVLVLRSNQFYGTISDMEFKTKINNSYFPTLRVFDISSNCFRGIMPKIVFELKALVTNSSEVSYPESRSLYYSYDEYQNSITAIWKGQEMEIKNSLSIFNYIDLSQNEFSGEIPEEVGQLKSLVVLNLSHNALTGLISSELANLQQLESLDLSSNQLSGPIPEELTSLTFLASLNLSYNNLVGKIPQARQFSTFSNASYLGNPGLCGSPLSIQCAIAPSNDVFNKSLPSKSSTDIIGQSISIGLGLGVGFASIFWAMVSWDNGREWFNFNVDRIYFLYLH